VITHDDMKKGVQGAIGGVLLGVGYAAKLADYGLHASELVLNGAENFVEAFVKAPKLGIGKSLFGSMRKGVQKFSDICMKKGRGMY
jgi:hypothetical protein